MVVSTVVAILLHQVHHDPMMSLDSVQHSIVRTSGWFPPVATTALIITFCIMGLIFLGIQREIPGSRLKKGGLFGLALSGMYLIGMIEVYVVFPVSLLGELYTGIADSCGILLMSFLLGKYLSDDTIRREKSVDTTFPAIIAIPVMYVLMRYFSYMIVHIESSYATRPIVTFLWTTGMGAWIAVMYRLVGSNIWPTHPLKHAAIFGGLVFGVNWLVFNLFFLLFIVIPVRDLLYRSVSDAFIVSLVVFICSKFQCKHSK